MMKISLVEDSENTGFWHWTLLKWDVDCWYNAACGLENSYGLACRKANEAYNEAKEDRDEKK